MAENPHPEQQATEAEATNGRAANGQFVKGNRGGPGNPYGRQVAELRKVLLARVTPEVLARIVDALIERAREGDVAAIRLMLQYALGSPLAGTSPDRVEHEEWELRASRPTMAEVAPVVMERPPLGIANAMGTGVDMKHWDDMRTGMARNNARADRRAARRQEREAKRAEKRRRRAGKRAGSPSANGGNGHDGHAAPSANGNGAAAPSTNGVGRDG